jgi:hypothetical protein
LKISAAIGEMTFWQCNRRRSVKMKSGWRGENGENGFIILNRGGVSSFGGGVKAAYPSVGGCLAAASRKYGGGVAAYENNINGGGRDSRESKRKMAAMASAAGG